MPPLQVPQRLYGRSRELATILDVFGRVERGETAMALVGGPAGIGKSALVAAFKAHLGDRPHRFLTGKFDQFQRHGAYAAVAQALAELVEQVLEGPADEEAAMREALAAALGPNGRIAVDWLPGLARLIGQPPPVAALNPTEEQNRFLSTIQALVGALARLERPLVLFLDDLQWGDAATLVLLRRLLAPQSPQALLVVGCYRDDEVAPDHPLRRAIAEWAVPPRVAAIRLSALDEEAIEQLLTEALEADRIRVRPLGRVLAGRSAGNPFYARELLRSWRADGLFTPDGPGGRWVWDLAAIEHATISDDIVAFMLGRIGRLNRNTQALLRQAACIGDTFELGLLARVASQPLSVTASAIEEAISAGLVATLSPVKMLLADEPPAAAVRCRFLHDRVRQAAYALSTPEEQRAIHVRIGRLLLAETPEARRAERAAEIAAQLNHGHSLIPDPEERRQLTLLNLEAARHAKEAAAYPTALVNTAAAFALLPGAPWETAPVLAREVYELHASMATLNGEHAVAEAAYQALLAHTPEAIDRAALHAVRASQYTYCNRMDLAIREGLEALALLGMPLVERPTMLAVGIELLKAKLALGRRRATDLEDAAPITDRPTRLAMRVLEGFLVPAYLSGNDTLFAATVLRQATLSFRHGNGPEAATAYSGYGVLLAGLGDWKGAQAFGALAERLAERYGVAAAPCRASVLHTLFGRSWSESWATLTPHFKSAVEVGLRSGDFLFGAYACNYVNLWDPGIELGRAIEEGRHYMAVARQSGYQNAQDATAIAHQTWRALRGETAGPLSLDGDGFDEAARLAGMTANGYASGLAIYHLAKLQLAVVFGQREAAWAALVSLEDHIRALAGSPYMVEYAVYGLQAAAWRAEAGGAGAAKRMRTFYRRLRSWARHHAGNFEHHGLWAEAETARLASQPERARRHYEAAIKAAGAGRFWRDEARAGERLADLHRSLGQADAARAALEAAREAYRRWGASGKVAALDAVDGQGPARYF